MDRGEWEDVRWAGGRGETVFRGPLLLVALLVRRPSHHRTMYGRTAMEGAKSSINGVDLFCFRYRETGREREKRDGGGKG